MTQSLLRIAGQRERPKAHGGQFPGAKTTWPADEPHRAAPRLCEAGTIHPRAAGRAKSNSAEIKRAALAHVQAQAIARRAERARRARRFLAAGTSLPPQALGAATARVPTALQHSFDSLADRWERETRHLSSPNAIAKHAACQEIIAMGDAVVPLILRRIIHRPWFWFDPLMKLTGEPVDPVKPEMYGDLRKMTDAWLKWGLKRGII